MNTLPSRLRTIACVAILALLVAVGGTSPARAQVARKQTAAPKPSPVTEVRLATKRDVAPGPKIRLYLNTRNVDTVTLSAFKIDTARWLREREERVLGEGPKPEPLPPGKPARVWPVIVGDRKLKPTPEQPDIYRSKQFNLPVLPPGAYLLVASGGGKQAWTVVNITNLAVVVKRAPRAVLTWVTDHQSGAPLSGARVSLWNRRGTRAIAQGMTRPDGTCLFAAAPNPEQTLIVERTGTKQPDLAGVALGNSDPDGRLTPHLQTDRPVYRPGGTMQYRAILRRTRGRGFVPEANMPFTAEIRDSRENVLQRTEERTNARGTLSGSFTVPAQGALGPYSLVLIARDKQQAYATFSVAEYRKPDFKVAVSPAQKRYLAGEQGRFQIQSDYYFGAPLAQAAVRYMVRRNPTPYFGGGFGDDPATAAWYASGDGNLYARDTYAAEPVVADGVVYTDAAGRAEIPFATKGDLPDSQYSVTCTVTDAQRRQVEAGSGVPVYSAALRIGIRTPIYAAPLNGIVPVELRLVDLDGKSAAGRVTLLTRQQVWDDKKKAYFQQELSRSTVNVPATGKASARVPAVKEGDVEILATVQDATGRRAAASTSLWVMNPDAKPEKQEQEPTVTLRLDRKAYQPGDSVQVFLTTTTPTRPTLLTVEGGDIFAYTVAPRGRTNFVWKLGATLAMSPNAHITAAQWARPAYMTAGNVQLPVPDRSRRLELTVSPDRTAGSYHPGDRATYTIRARDGQTGKPVSGAEVALAVVDESIFAVRPDATPDPYTHFWGFRPDLTETRSSAPEEVSGGAFQRAAPDGIAPVRERFLDTAFWGPQIVTGPDGTVTATVDLPGNLTAWRATAIGVTDSTQVGRSTAQVTASRPVMLRLATPRQFVQGDAITLIGTINNRTDTERRFEVTLTAEGISLADGETAAKTATVPARGEGKVEWRVAASSIPASDGVARLEGTLVVTNRGENETLADLSDRLRLSVPVRPRGVATRLRTGGPVRSEQTTLTMDLPTDRIEPASTLTVTLRGGAAQAARAEAAALYGGYAYGTVPAADRLLLAATPGAPAPRDPTALRDAIALLSRLQIGNGSWGWWEGTSSDPRITARVLTALRVLRERPGALPPDVPFPDKLLRIGIMGGETLYNQTSLWEERAYLAVALAALDEKYRPRLTEVVKRNAGTLSPAATLLLARGLFAAGQKDTARRLTREAIAIAVIGPDSAYIPAGERPGWQASVVETTAQALETLTALGEDDALQAKLARWLVLPSDGDNPLYTTESDRALAARALLLYAQAHSGDTGGRTPVREQDYTLTVNGTAVPWTTRAPGTEETAPLTAAVPRSLLKDGANTLLLRRLGGSEESFASAEAVVYRPQTMEADAGMRVLRRFETQTDFGTWTQVAEGTTIRPSAPVRVTVVVWPSEEADALRVIEPIPSGFEFVDAEPSASSRDEVRDGALVHYLRVDGAAPVTFRYYLRAESEGALSALPATGEMIRRPAVRGGSAAQTLTVREEQKVP